MTMTDDYRDETGPVDVDDLLAQLRGLAKTKNEIEAEYQALRDEITPILGEEERFFVDMNGNKLIAHRVVPDNLVIDLDLLYQLVPQAVYDEVTKTVADNDAFKRAVKAGRIPREVVAQVARVVPGKAWVRFSDPALG